VQVELLEAVEYACASYINIVIVLIKLIDDGFLGQEAHGPDLPEKVFYDFVLPFKEYNFSKQYLVLKL